MNVPIVDERAFPPGTVRLSDRAESHLVLSPQPTSDPNDPLNWSTFRKSLVIFLLSLYGIIVVALLTSAVPVWEAMNQDLGFSFVDLNNSYGVSAATLSIGCLSFVPFALRFGRRPIYILTSLLMFITGIWSAKMQTIGDLMGTNAVMGLAGSVNEALFQMTVSDLFFVHQRGTLNGILLIMVTIGNYFAPVAAGYVGVSENWRWVFWYIAIFQGVVTILFIFFLEETKYIPDPADHIIVPVTIREERTLVGGQAEETVDSEKQNTLEPETTGKDLNRAESGGVRHNSVVSIRYDVAEDASKRLVEIDHSIPIRSWRRRHALWTTNGSRRVSYEWWRHLYQPFALLFLFPAVAFAAVQWAFVLSALSVVAVSQSDLYTLPPYNFSTAGVGNLNIPPAIGAILGCIWGGPVVDWFLVKLAQRNKGIYEPEFRLTFFVLPGVLMPIGVFMYGLTTAEGKPWIIPCIGTGFIGFAIGGVGDIALTYLQDSYLEILPDALIGVAFIRNIMATILVFVIQPWFNGMGVYDSFVLLGCLSVLFSLFAVPIYVFGKRFRWRCAERYRYYASKQFVIRSI